MKEPRSRIGAAFTLFAGIASVAAWFGVTPDLVGKVAYGFIHPALPFFTFFSGFFTGVFARDWMRWRDKVLASRIEADEAERRSKDELAALSVEFKGFDVDVKALACIAYDDGEYVFEYGPDGLGPMSWQVARIADVETVPDGSFRYTLKPTVRGMFDENPELLDEMRRYIEENKDAE